MNGTDGSLEQMQRCHSLSEVHSTNQTVSSAEPGGGLVYSESAYPVLVYIIIFQVHTPLVLERTEGVYRVVSLHFHLSSLNWLYLYRDYFFKDHMHTPRDTSLDVILQGFSLTQIFREYNKGKQ